MPEDWVDRNDRIAVFTPFGKEWSPDLAYGPFVGLGLYVRLGARGSEAFLFSK